VELSQREKTSIPLSIAAILTVAWAHLSLVSLSNLLIWLAYMGIVTFFRVLVSRRNIAAIDDLINLTRFRNYRILLASFYGAGWGLIMFLLDTGQLDFSLVLRFCTLIAILAVTMNIMSVVLPVYLGMISAPILILLVFILYRLPYASEHGKLTLIIAETTFTLILMLSSTNAAKLSRNAFLQGFERNSALEESNMLRKQLEVIALHDGLTNVFNRRFLIKELERNVNTLKRHKTGFSIILIDLDHFKNVNDTYGHPIGDRVLIGLTQFVLSKLREIDVFGRWGGEEFLCILPNTEFDGAMICAERLRVGLENTRMISELPELIVTASFGLVICHDHEGVEDIMQRVDEALYQAKSGGRNRVIGDVYPALS
jgi:diguanylate cyclase (GGDEF)-like protein